MVFHFFQILCFSNFWNVSSQQIQGNKPTMEIVIKNYKKLWKAMDSYDKLWKTMTNYDWVMFHMLAHNCFYLSSISHSIHFVQEIIIGAMNDAKPPTSYKKSSGRWTGRSHQLPTRNHHRCNERGEASYNGKVSSSRSTSAKLNHFLPYTAQLLWCRRHAPP